MSRGSHPKFAAAGGRAGFVAGRNRLLRASFYRVYDPYYTDYHAWNNDEVRLLQPLGGRDPPRSHRDFRKLRPEEQKEYWTWRHNHGDHDRDHDPRSRSSLAIEARLSGEGPESLVRVVSLRSKLLNSAIVFWPSSVSRSQWRPARPRLGVRVRADLLRQN